MVAAMTIDRDELARALEPVHQRVVHVVVAMTIGWLALSVSAITIGSLNGGALFRAIVWCVAIGSLVATVMGLWYRARRNAIANLLAAVEQGDALYRRECNKILLWWIFPVGYDVSIYAVDASKRRTHVVFGCWRHHQIQRLLEVLAPSFVDGPLPPIQIAWKRPDRARVDRNDHGAFPTATIVRDKPTRPDART